LKSLAPVTATSVSCLVAPDGTARLCRDRKKGGAVDHCRFRRVPWISRLDDFPDSVSSGILPSPESQSADCANAPPEWINLCLRGNRQGNFYLQPASRMIAKTDLAAMAANHRLRRRQPKTRPPGRAVP
jgi:hypothetical protein